jgi:hypothetical protein
MGFFILNLIPFNAHPQPNGTKNAQPGGLSVFVKSNADSGKIFSLFTGDQ